MQVCRSLLLLLGALALSSGKQLEDPSRLCNLCNMDVSLVVKVLQSGGSICLWNLRQVDTEVLFDRCCTRR